VLLLCYLSIHVAAGLGFLLPFTIISVTQGQMCHPWHKARDAGKRAQIERKGLCKRTYKIRERNTGKQPKKPNVTLNT
jgi:hypothetical protein